MRTSREPAPYPYDRLRRVARERLPWLRRTARAIGPLATAAAEERARGLLGAPLTVRPSPLEVCPAGGLVAALTDPLVAVVLSRDDGRLGGRIAVELDPRFAACCIDRALGGEAEGLTPPTTPLSHAERGVLSFVAAQLLAASGAPFVVLGVVTAPAALAGALGDAPIAALPASLRLGDASGFARAWLPEAALDIGQLAPPSDAPRLRALPLELHLDGAWGTLSGAEVEGLRAGDAVLFDESWLRAEGGTFVGAGRARLAGARRMTIRCALEGDSVRVTDIELHADPGVREGKVMETNSGTDDTREVTANRAGDVPVEIALELARFTMPLAEVAGLAVGEVLATGSALGGRVTLRANGQAVASGELVDVDGEVGLRILSLAE